MGYYVGTVIIKRRVDAWEERVRYRNEKKTLDKKVVEMEGGGRSRNVVEL